MNPENLLVAGMLLAAMVLVGKLLIPIAHAFARRMDGKTGGPEHALEIADLEARVRDLEARESRMAELEERLDFTERLLAQQRDLSRLGAGEER